MGVGPGPLRNAGIGSPACGHPFPAVVVASTNDAFSTIDRARLLARVWGAGFVDAGACGHINVASGFGPWPQGENILRELARGTLACCANAPDPLVDRTTVCAPQSILRRCLSADQQNAPATRPARASSASMPSSFPAETSDTIPFSDRSTIFSPAFIIGECTRRKCRLRYSAMRSPEPPSSAGKSFSFGRPSRIGRTVSA